MIGHTPGPFEIKPGAFSYQIDIKKGADCLATVYGSIGQNLGNAHLFAAAPDMMEALEFIEKTFGPIRDNLIFSKRLAIDKARAAIAKAKGIAKASQSEP